ncbi:MAG TPA: DUF1214 domain-containing protein [Alphaproteobacteria bacterium]|jgi:hypothetical protein|nr:DUF1214 domain-containing protein [Alphaproteobacteria bacterium]
MTLHLSPAMEAAWAAHHREIEELRRHVYGSALAADPADQARAHYWFMQAQALAFNLTIAPRQSHPAFFTGTVFEPNHYTWILPNADFLYRYAFVDGARQYRVTGRRGTSHFLEAQTISGFFGDPNLKLLKTYDFDRLEIAPDGSFEIGVGPEPLPGCPNWIATDRGQGNNTIIVREAFYDWTGETAATLRIEPVDPGPMTVLDEPEMIRRLGAAARLMKFCHNTFSGGLTDQVLSAVGTNRFLLVDTSKDEHASNPSAGYVPCVYDLKPGEALLVEVDRPQARYWNIHLGDVWWQVTDFTHHHSSLNGHQARFDSDGKARIVIAGEDPGVANWLDTVGVVKGVALLRWYFTDSYPAPAARVVRVDELRGLLPAETVWVTAEERVRVVAERRAAVLRRYGH